MSNRCKDCMDGEHDDYDNDIKYVDIVDPKSNLKLKRALLCSEHRQMYENDGYVLKSVEIGSRRESPY